MTAMGFLYSNDCTIMAQAITLAHCCWFDDNVDDLVDDTEIVMKMVVMR
jgi:hypothetical protein